MGSLLVPKSVTLNDQWPLLLVISLNSVALQGVSYVKVVEDSPILSAIKM